ncbi:6-O-methylguanine DNA methyltransferase [Aspergillus pseudotamarii]|uniref:Methylated-DNA--protein-cysteine methyltransferase n=1 Tax=Aspergillus pseudotamarii TaxID=132259 RepID=A0A5N6TCK4_ASPPS|nr:6-O-methylguanine DNA methyltransferase [Aspergillus pseudotamarii]KAE8144022.1 6-O-methylguanine DNA methyltransferase [Aspergillus pseudotamarii]
MATTKPQELESQQPTITTTTTSPSPSPSPSPQKNNSSTSTSTPTPQTLKQIHRIKSHPTLTPHRRRVYLTLLSIPAGRWTTYAALAKHLNSSARAIGTAMRTNPFAPDVPCHRVLSADGGLGGYMGAGPASGHANLERKRMMLEEEGVGFEWVGSSKDRSKGMGTCSSIASGRRKGSGGEGRWRAKGECFVGFPAL